MFNFIDSGNYLKYFDTDRIKKIGESTLAEPIACHLYVDDKKTVFQQAVDQPPTYVYGELYTGIDVPVIAQRIKVEKVNPNTGKAIAVYEGIPSKPIVCQSRIKYDVQFVEAIEPTYPRTISVQVWDDVEEKYYDAQGLTMTLTSANTIVPEKGFTYGEWGEFSETTWVVVAVNNKLFTDGDYGYIKNIDDDVYYKLSGNVYPDWEKVTYTLTEEPVPTPKPPFNVPYKVDYWDEITASWADTGGAEIQIISEGQYNKKCNAVSGIKVETDKYGNDVFTLTNIGVTIESYQKIYLREVGGNQAIIYIDSLGYPASSQNMSYENIKESEMEV